MLKINELDRIYLGVQQENAARTIPIDMSAWASIYPNATADILHKRTGDQTKYLTGATYDSDTHILSWTPSEYDTFYNGFGIAEIRMVENNVVKKSKDLIVVAVSPSVIDGTGDVIASTYQAWLNTVLAYKQGAQAAQTAAETAQGKAEDAQEAAEAAQTAVEDAMETWPKIDETTKHWLVWDVENGEYVDTGVKAEGVDGQDGYTPVRGTDYWTPADIAAMEGDVEAYADKIIQVTSSQPSDPQAKIWVDDTLPTPVQVPTYEEHQALAAEVDDKYEKPAGGIPATDLASGVIPDVTGKLDKPATAGTQGQVLTSDGNGGQTWEDPTGGDPTEIIDDTAGTGDTNKVWSADKLAGDFSDVNSALTGKQDAPASGATAGKVLGLVEDNNELKPSWVSQPSVPVTDVQVNGTSVMSQGVANVPVGSAGTLGVVKTHDTNIGLSGISITDGMLAIEKATSDRIKAGTNNNMPIVPANQNEATFYGLAKCAGDSSQSSSSNSVGTYTEDALSKISDMLNATVSVSGSTPSITAKSGVRYICGECSTLTITIPASGCIDVTFESGSTATVLTVTPTKTGVTAVKWANGFDPTSLDANTTYEINILDGEYGVVCAWT